MGDPDYANDTLTEKGWREAALLAERVSGWDVTDFYVSPLGRAQDTASLSLKKMGRSAETMEWLREFHGPVKDPLRGDNAHPWDFYPEYWTKIPAMYDKDGFLDTDVMKSGNVKEEYLRIGKCLDGLLEKYGYVREGGIYRTDRTQKADRDATIVLFCHMGVTLFLCGHLLGDFPCGADKRVFPGSHFGNGAGIRGKGARGFLFPVPDGGGYGPFESGRGAGFLYGIFYGAFSGVKRDRQNKVGRN